MRWCSRLVESILHYLLAFVDGLDGVRVRARIAAIYVSRYLPTELKTEDLLRSLQVHRALQGSSSEVKTVEFALFLNVGRIDRCYISSFWSVL